MPIQVEYQIYPSMLWYPCMYEHDVVENLLQTQFHNFIERVKTTDCQAELRRLLKDGPPIYISDRHALPLPGDTLDDATAMATTSVTATDNDDDAGTTTNDDNDNNTSSPTSIEEEEQQQQQQKPYICKLWYATSPDEKISSKLHGAVEGDDRDNLWTELKKFLVEEGKEPGDDDE